MAKATQGTEIAHYDMRWLKPIDTQTLDYVGTHFKVVFTAEDGTTIGGLGSAVLEYFAIKDYHCKVVTLGVNDQFVEHGSVSELNEMLGLDAASIRKLLNEVIADNDNK